MTKLKKFKVQENQYERPYHHLINLSSNKTYDYLYWGLEYFGYVKFIISQISKIKKNSSIAEIGCGDGKISIEIAKLLPNSKIEGYDLANQAIAFANSYSYNLKNCNFYDVDFNESNRKYDLTLAVEVLEHIPDSLVQSFISMIANKTKSDGFFLISVPTINIKLNKKHYRHYDFNLLKEHIGDSFEIKKHFFIHNENSIRYKLIRSLLINRFFIINSNLIRDFLFKFYEKKLLMANHNTGAHLIAICKKK